MENKNPGPSVYYVTDKNIFDALNEHKVTTEIMIHLLASRNTIASPHEKKAELARYFSQLTHDYFDNQTIASVLGVASRRERVTSLYVEGAVGEDGLRRAIEHVAEEHRRYGDLVDVRKRPNGFLISIQYSKVDYRRSEFNQVQVKDAEVDAVCVQGGVEIRSTQNDHIDSFRDEIVFRLRDEHDDIVRKDITLQAHTDPVKRSKFFHDLFTGIEGYAFQNVTDLFVFRPSEGGEEAPEVERVALRGYSVNSTKIFTDLAADGYYIVRAIWVAKESSNEGNLYTIEAVFTDPETCSDFSYLVVGVQDRKNEVLSSRRRTPTRMESSSVSRAIEHRARELMAALSVPAGQAHDAV